MSESPPKQRPLSSKPIFKQAFCFEDDEIYKLISVSGNAVSEIERQYLTTMTECQTLSTLKIKLFSKINQLSKRGAEVIDKLIATHPVYKEHKMLQYRIRSKKFAIRFNSPKSVIICENQIVSIRTSRSSN